MSPRSTRSTIPSDHRPPDPVPIGDIIAELLRRHGETLTTADRLVPRERKGGRP